jgi:hypothetical protein
MDGNILYKLIFIMILATAVCLPHAVIASPRNVQTVYFKPVPLEKSDRIYIVEADLKCGHFSDFRAIPEDWSVQLTRAISGVEKLKMEAGHGSSQLLDIKELNGIIGITKHAEPSCFQLSATAIVTIDAEQQKRVNVKTELKPWSSK